MASSKVTCSRHDIAEILLKVALNNKNQNQINRSASCSGIKPKMYRTLFTQHCHQMLNVLYKSFNNINTTLT
jgi:hypothetical protein